MRKSKKKRKEFVNMEATVSKIQSLLTDPNVVNWVTSGGARGVRSRLLKIDYNVLRSVVDKVPLIGSIINTRIDQILPFCTYITEEQAKEGEKGFFFSSSNRRNSKDYDPEEADKLGDFIEQTGFDYSSMREDDFSDYIQMFIREVLTIDQIASELQYNRLHEVIAFWLIDGATVKRTTDKYKSKNVDYVQEIEGKVTAEYSANNLIFDYKNKRVDIRFRGYGYSIVEMCVDLVTTLLFGYTHLRDQFVKDKIPKGFISVMGDIDKTGITAIQNYWYSAMSGAGGSWNIPILPSGKDGVGLDFKSLGQSNRDMEYHKGMMFVSSIIGALFSIDLAELGIKADDSTSLIGETSEPRIQHSKDRGLRSLLIFASQHVNKIVRKVTTKYKFHFSGLEVQDHQRRAEIRKKKLETDTSIDELREQDGKKPYKEEWSQIPLNPQAVQLFLALKSQQQQAEMREESAGEEEGFEEGGQEVPLEEEQPVGEEEEASKPKDWRDLFKALTDEKEKLTVY